MSNTTKVLTLPTARKVITDQNKLIEDGISLRARTTAFRRQPLIEVGEYLRDSYEDTVTTAQQNVDTLNDLLALIIEDVRAANPATVVQGYNYDGKNAVDSTVLIYWPTKKDTPQLANSARNDYNAMKRHFDKRGSLVALAKKWLALNEAKRFERAPKKGPTTVKFTEAEVVAIMVIEKGLTKAEAEKLVAKYAAAKAAA